MRTIAMVQCDSRITPQLVGTLQRVRNEDLYYALNRTHTYSCIRSVSIAAMAALKVAKASCTR